MSRTRQALAAATMAAAAAGGGLLLAAAGAGPAYAAASVITPAAAAGDHPSSITFHFDPPPSTTGAHARVAPHDVTTINCTVEAGAIHPGPVGIGAIATVICTDNVPLINMTQTMSSSVSSIPPTGDNVSNSGFALSTINTACVGGTYANTAVAQITFPPGWSTTQGSGNTGIIADHGPSTLVFQSDCSPPSAPPTVPPPANPPPPTGGSSGCSITSPSPAAHPAGRHPGLITC